MHGNGFDDDHANEGRQDLDLAADTTPLLHATKTADSHRNYDTNRD
jgi:hypothetical protein